MPTEARDRGPLVSVAIPVYNGEATIGQALHSVLAQTHRNLEVIVVDDGSTDDTWAVLQSFGDSIRAIRQPNGGIAVARNTGVQAARGEFIALMDDDDLCEPERIAVQLRFLKERPEVILCCSDFSAFDASGPVSGSHTAAYYSRCSASEGGVRARYPNRGPLDISGCLATLSNADDVVSTYFGKVYEELALGNFVHPPTVMFRRSVLQEAGPFDPETKSSGDWGWLVNVARLGAIGFIDRPLLRYRISAAQISSSTRAPMDALTVAHRICARDPSLFARQPGRFRSLFGELYAWAADTRAENQPAQALTLLATGVFRYRAWSRQTPVTLFKILAPTALLRWLRAKRETSRHAVIRRRCGTGPPA
jgi:glycosyltransferase involved in cell wall biosynthesis